MRNEAVHILKFIWRFSQIIAERRKVPFHVIQPIIMVMTHTQVNFSASPWPEIGVLLLERSVSRLSLVSHMVRVKAVLCMLV